MTRYILAGGADRTVGGKKFLDAILEGFDRPVKVLDCFFAETRETWDERFRAWCDFYEKNAGKGTVEATLAFPDVFPQQAAGADIIYLHGGDNALLAHYLGKYPNLTDIFAGKTVLGSSAGASFLSAYNWTCDWREVQKGSGIVPVRVVVHYGSDYGKNDSRGPIDWEAAKKELEAFAPDMPLHCLSEGELIVVEQDDENNRDQATG